MSIKTLIKSFTKGSLRSGRSLLSLKWNKTGSLLRRGDKTSKRHLKLVQLSSKARILNFRCAQLNLQPRSTRTKSCSSSMLSYFKSLKDMKRSTKSYLQRIRDLRLVWSHWKKRKQGAYIIAKTSTKSALFIAAYCRDLTQYQTWLTKVIWATLILCCWQQTEPHYLHNQAPSN